jgi:hypothetical protein
MPVDDRTYTAMTTEHFALVGARSQAASESSTRSALYLGGVSSTLVGLGLTAQVSAGHSTFHIFALVALPTLFTLGVFTFARLVELGAEDFMLGRAINRIRHYYISEAGEASKYFLLTGYDDHYGVMANMALSTEAWWQLYLTAAVAVAVVNSVVGGSAVALAVGVFTDAPLGIVVAAGGTFAIVALFGHLRFQATTHSSGGGDTDVLFPTPTSARPDRANDHHGASESR